MLTPLGVGPGQPFPYISGLSLSLGVLARDPDTGEERFARVKVPEGLPRFFPIGSRGCLLLLEQVITHFLDRLFPGMEILEHTVFRVTRDADFELSDDADDLLEAVETELRRRRFGDVVRVEVSSSTSRGMLERLQQGFDASDDQVYEIHGLIDLADLDQLIGFDRPDLKHPPVPGSTPVRLAHVKQARDLFDEIRRNDILVHQPYESFCSELRGVRARGRARPRRDRDEDGRVPHERRQPAHPGAHRVRRGRQAERLPRRAEGALRRAPQHRVVAGARAGRRPRRLRLSRPEGAREDDARRPPRGKRRCGATSTSAPATTTPSPRDRTRTSASTRRTRRSQTTSPSSSTT